MNQLDHELKAELRQIVNNSVAMTDETEYPASIILELNVSPEPEIYQAVTNYVGWILQRYNMVHWRDDPNELVISFRPYNKELDASVIGTLHH